MQNYGSVMFCIGINEGKTTALSPSCANPINLQTGLQSVTHESIPGLGSILQVNSLDIGGGAESIAWNLFQAFRSAGYESKLLVGRKLTCDPDVHVVPNLESKGLWGRTWARIAGVVAASRLSNSARQVLRQVCLGLSDPISGIERLRGFECNRYPGTWKILELGIGRPDIVHVHNLHGGYFDLEALPWISAQVPTLLTIHDAWLLSGHCAHSFSCERWKTGCGQCPDLSIPPAILRDATHHNWLKKKEILRRCRLTLVAPSKWLIEKAQQSILSAGVTGYHVIPNGVDLKVFCPADKREARAALELPISSPIILFVANGGSTNRWKDFALMKSAVTQLSRRGQQRVVFVVVGESGGSEHWDGIELRRAGVIMGPTNMARYYNAADIYLHAAKADTFPNAVIESLACGTPIVASAVGGIPEQVRPYRASDGVDRGEATGILFPEGDVDAAVSALATLLGDQSLRRQLGQNAAGDASERFGLNKQIAEYQYLYQSMIEQHRASL